MTLLKKLLKEEAITKPSTKVDVKNLAERIASTCLVDQKRTRYTTSKLDLAEIRDRREDQEPKINIRDCILIRCIIPILSHNCIRKLKILLS